MPGTLDAILLAAVELAEEGNLDAAQALLNAPARLSLGGEETTRVLSPVEQAMEDGILATSLLADDLRSRVAALAKKKYPPTSY